MTALETAKETRRMAEKALEEEAKAKERERKARAVCAKAKPRRGRERLELSVQKLRKRPCLLKRSRECGSLHAFCHGSFLLLLCCCCCCFGSIEFSGVKRPRLLP